MIFTESRSATRLAYLLHIRSKTNSSRRMSASEMTYTASDGALNSILGVGGCRRLTIIHGVIAVIIRGRLDSAVYVCLAAAAVDASD